jgi:hypothetical protein
VVTALAAIAWAAAPQKQQQQGARQSEQGGQTVANAQMWVYRIDPIPGMEEWSGNYTDDVKIGVITRNAAKNERLLNQRASEGWELAAVTGWTYIFKHPK